jgi:hypothetical protein
MRLGWSSEMVLPQVDFVVTAMEKRITAFETPKAGTLYGAQSGCTV